MEKENEFSFYDGVRVCFFIVFGYVGIGIVVGVVGKVFYLSFLEVMLFVIIVYVGVV